jgi:plastocyanin
MNQEPEQQPKSATEQSLDRRKILGLIGAGTLGVAAWVAIDPVEARHGDDDDDYDDDDHSGHGGGGDDDDDDHGLSGPQVQTSMVEIVDERYEPSRIRVATGTTVTWINRDDDDHTASAPGMETGTIREGSSGTVTFLSPGRFTYHCNFHPEMTGEIEVVGDALATLESATPEASPVPNAPDAATVKIVDFGFDPPDVTIKAGGKVTWANSGEVPHSILATEVHSEILDPGATFTWTASGSGEISYQCGLHPSMQGTVTVIDPES